MSIRLANVRWGDESNRGQRDRCELVHVRIGAKKAGVAKLVLHELERALALGGRSAAPERSGLIVQNFDSR
jgi:hypothetical protein